MVTGLLLAAFMVLLGIGAGYRQVSAIKRARSERFMAEEDRRYIRRQAKRRLVISALLLIEGGMLSTYYLSGMDARMDAIPERNKAEVQASADEVQDQDKRFTRLVAFYWIAVVLILAVFVGVTVIDVWATRKYWMTRYWEIKAEHEAKLQRDLAVYRQQKLNERAKGLKKPDDDTAEEPPVED